MNNEKNYSEEHFETYLKSQKIKFEREKDLDIRENSSKKTPDYQICFEGKDYVFEFKEFAKKEETRRFDTIETILSPIREKIRKSSNQFKDFTDKSCNLVLYSHDFFIWQDILNPKYVYSAMLGDFGYSIPIWHDDISNNSKEIYPTFFENGKMLYKGRVQNTRISSLIVLSFYYNKVDQENKISFIVYENPFAKIQLSRNIFCSDYDIRFGKVGNEIKQLFVGKKILNNPKNYKDFLIQIK